MDGGEEEEEEEEALDGAELSQSRGSICAPHRCPLQILLRGQTANQAEANVEINQDHLS